jgi:hypothetical protein
LSLGALTLSYAKFKTWLTLWCELYPTWRLHILAHALLDGLICIIPMISIAFSYSICSLLVPLLC